MKTNTHNPWLEVDEGTPIENTGTATKVVGWALLLPTLAAYWLFKLPFRMACSVIEVAAAQPDIDDDDEAEGLGLYEKEAHESDYDLEKFNDRDGGFKYGEYLGQTEK